MLDNLNVTNLLEKPIYLGVRYGIVNLTPLNCVALCCQNFEIHSLFVVYVFSSMKINVLNRFDQLYWLAAG